MFLRFWFLRKLKKDAGFYFCRASILQVRLESPLGQRILHASGLFREGIDHMDVFHFPFFINNDSHRHLGEFRSCLDWIYPVQHIGAGGIILHASWEWSSACRRVGNGRKQQAVHIAGKLFQNSAITDGDLKGDHMAAYVGCEDGVIQSRAAVIQTRESVIANPGFTGRSLNLERGCNRLLLSPFEQIH